MSPTKPRRMDAYIRVSRVGGRDTESESYITEAVQREKIEAWASLRDIEIAAWHMDRDVSGSKLSRPGFDTCMRRIRDGKTDGVIVAAIDRLSRADVADALMIVRQIHDDYNGTLAAVDLGIDPTTEVGEMLLTVLLALARMQWRRYQAAWDTAKERAIKRGVHIGPTPIGYTRAEGGRLEPSLDGAVIREAYRAAASGDVSAAMRVLTASDLDYVWNTMTVRRVLSNRVYLGEIRFGVYENKEAHEPLIDLATWTKANKNLVGTRPYVRSRDGYPLSQVAECAGCGSGLTGNRMADDLRSYRCRKNVTAAVRRGEEKACPAPALSLAENLEEYVLALLVKYVAEERPDDVAVLKAGTSKALIEEAEVALRSAELARDLDLRDLDLPREVLAPRLEAHEIKIAAAQKNYEAAVADASDELTWPLVDEIATATTADLAALMERCGVVVKVAKGRGNLTERVWIERKT